MKISKQSIRDPKPYLVEVAPNDDFYVVVPNATIKNSILERYGLSTDGKVRVPIGRCRATLFNADGKFLVNRELPKIEKVFEHEYHVVDWHGNDHYGTCFQRRMCYQKDYIFPPNIGFFFEGNSLFSEKLNNAENNYENIKSAINVALEMFGACEIWSKDKTPILPNIPEISVPWEILRKGTRDSEVWEKYLTNTVKGKSKSQQTIIRNRHEFIHSLNPDYRVLGSQNFYGYIVYAFNNEQLFVFECNNVNNATYFFVGGWKEVSQLSKTQILTGNFHHARVFHTENWCEKVKETVILGRGRDNG